MTYNSLQLVKMSIFGNIDEHVLINNDIVNCLNQIINWSNNHFMKINPDKTEILLLCPASLNREVVIKGVFFEEQCIRFSNEVKNVGVWI